MSHLDILRELQSTLDYLHTIERDLSKFPPDLAEVDGRLKKLKHQIAEAGKAMAELAPKLQAAEKAFAQAQKEELYARAQLKLATQKIQYAAAIRELDEKERARLQAERARKELETKRDQLEQQLGSLGQAEETDQRSFDELHQVFLAEHETQVLAKEKLLAKRTELENQLGAPELARFRKVLTQRGGKAVVAVESGACSGCRIKLRNAFLNQLREAKALLCCESCQRFLYMP